MWGTPVYGNNEADQNFLKSMGYQPGQYVNYASPRMPGRSPVDWGGAFGWGGGGGGSSGQDSQALLDQIMRGNRMPTVDWPGAFGGGGGGGGSSGASVLQGIIGGQPSVTTPEQAIAGTGAGFSSQFPSYLDKLMGSNPELQQTINYLLGNVMNGPSANDKASWARGIEEGLTKLGSGNLGADSRAQYETYNIEADRNWRLQQLGLLSGFTGQKGSLIGNAASNVWGTSDNMNRTSLNLSYQDSMLWKQLMGGAAGADQANNNAMTRDAWRAWLDLWGGNGGASAMVEMNDPRSMPSGGQTFLDTSLSDNRFNDFVMGNNYNSFYDQMMSDPSWWTPSGGGMAAGGAGGMVNEGNMPVL